MTRGRGAAQAGAGKARAAHGYFCGDELFIILPHFPLESAQLFIAERG